MPDTDNKEKLTDEDLESIDEEPKRRVPWVPIAVGVGAVIAGSGLGMAAVGPALASDSNEPPEAAVEAEAEPAYDEPEHAEPHVGAVIEFDNLIVNPAGSEGLRFVMATVGVGVESEKIQEELHELDLPIRDRITSVLESQTLEALVAPGARENLKVIIAEAVAPFLEGYSEFVIYIPHFVIQ